MHPPAIAGMFADCPDATLELVGYVVGLMSGGSYEWILHLGKLSMLSSLLPTADNGSGPGTQGFGNSEDLVTLYLLAHVLYDAAEIMQGHSQSLLLDWHFLLCE